MKYLKIISLLCLLSCISVVKSSAQEIEENTTFSDSVAIDEIIVHSLYSEQKLLETAGTLSIISANQLHSTPTFSIANSLNQVPGIIMQSGSINTNRIVIRGSGSRSPYGSNKIRAYYEDIPLTNGSGETIIEDIDLQSVASLEILKGPASGLYGSGLGGTLIFKQLNDKDNYISQNLSSGSFNTYESNTIFSSGTEKLSNKFVLSHLSSKAYRDNNETKRTNLSYINRLKNPSGNINILVNYTQLKAFIPSSLDKETFETTPNQAANNWATTKGYEDYKKFFAGVSKELKLRTGSSGKISAFYHLKNNNELRPFNFLKETTNYWGTRSFINKKYEYKQFEHQWLVGTEIFFERYNWSTHENDNREAGSLISDNHESRDYYNLFAMYRFSKKENYNIRLSLNISRYSYTYDDNFTADGDQSAEYGFKPVISPFFTSNFKFAKKSWIFFSATHGFSPPSLEETLMPDGQRNTNIKPETAWNFEVGVKSKFSNNSYIELSFYHQILDNLLVAKRVEEDAFIGINAGKSKLQGIELNFHQDLINSKQWISHLNLTGYYAPGKFISFIDGDNDYSGNRLTGWPDKSATLKIQNTLWSRLDLNIDFQYTDKMPMRDDNSIYSEAYSLINLYSAFKSRLFGLNSKIYFGVNNILNSKYASMILINANSFGNSQPRYYYPGLPVNFKFGILAKLPI